MHRHPESQADRLGIILSAICVAHCVLTPFAIMLLPIMGRYYIAHPLVHYGLAMAVVPVGLYAFVTGFKEHGRLRVLLFGLLGMLIVSLAPIAVHVLLMPINEALMMILGGSMLVWAHWQNRRFCQAC